MEHGRSKARFKATVLSAVLSGTAMMLMAPAVEAVTLQTKSYVYDALGRVTQEKDAANTVLVTHTYDANGNRKTSTDALGRVTTNDYDELNRLTKTTVTANSVVQSVTEYGYDARDNLVSVKDPRNLITTYSYNGFDQLTSQASPDTGTTSYVPNMAGQVTTRTNAASQATQYQYDVLGRVSQASYADGRVVTYSYDQGTNGQGRLTSMSDSDTALSWTYNVDGQVQTRMQTLGSGPTAQTSTLTYGYNSAGQLTSLTYPSGAVIGYAYDDQGRVASITRNGTVVLNGIQYRPFGGITQWTWGNGQLHNRLYDQDGRLDFISVGPTVHDLNYDAVSRIDEILDMANSSLNRDFSYDALDRLTGYVGQNSTRVWNYDAVGNRTSQEIVGATTETYTYASTSNRLQSLTNSANSQQNRSYQYTSTGHTSSDGKNTFTYDARERLTSVTNATANASYMLNPLGQRVKKSVTSSGATTTATFVYDEAGHLVAEAEPTGSGAEYVYLGNTPVAVFKTTVQSTTGTPIVVDPSTQAAGGNNLWQLAASVGSQFYGSNFLRKWSFGGVQEGVLVDENNTYNVAPNAAVKTGTWYALDPYYVQEATNGTAVVAGGHQGVHSGTIIDQVTLSGYWLQLNYADCQGGICFRGARSTTSTPTLTATWTANIATAGEYELYSSTPAANPATNPRYTIQYGGTSTLVIPAGANNPGWVSLGKFQLPAGTLSITLDNVTNHNFVFADAIMVSPTSAPLLPFKTVEWTANLSDAGTYNVYARRGCNSANTPTAYYTVATNQGDVESVVSQAGTVGTWVLIGSFPFNAGLNKVTLRNQSSPSYAVCADSVIFAKPDADLGFFNDVKFVPTLPSAGTYEVQAWWPMASGSNSVWYYVYHTQGKTKVVKNQNIQGGQWVSLGQFNLDPATAKVTLADYGDANKRIYADAVRFIPVSTTTTSALYNIHADHLDTPRQLTTSDANNTVVWRWDSEPFGSTLANADPDNNGQQVAFNLRFPGQYFDGETGLHYNYFRDYDPGIGRYVQSDPIGIEGGANTYAYVDGSPVDFADPEGLAAEVATGVVGSGLRGVAAGSRGGLAGAVVGGVVGIGVGLACSQNGSDDKCALIREDINKLVRDLESRFKMMQRDPLGLYTRRPTGSDSWAGHRQRFYKERGDLAKLIAEAKALGCTYNPEADKWVVKEPPSRPTRFNQPRR